MVSFGGKDDNQQSSVLSRQTWKRVRSSIRLLAFHLGGTRRWLDSPGCLGFVDAFGSFAMKRECIVLFFCYRLKGFLLLLLGRSPVKRPVGRGFQGRACRAMRAMAGMPRKWNPKSRALATGEGREVRRSVLGEELSFFVCLEEFFFFF